MCRLLRVARAQVRPVTQTDMQYVYVLYMYIVYVHAENLPSQNVYSDVIDVHKNVVRAWASHSYCIHTLLGLFAPPPERVD